MEGYLLALQRPLQELYNGMLAEELWAFLEANHPQAIGPINPHNAEIERRFGDQGGF